MTRGCPTHYCSQFHLNMLPCAHASPGEFTQSPKRKKRGNKTFILFSRSPPVDTWFHMAAVWDRNANQAYILLDGQKVGTQAQESGSYLRDNSRKVFDIGLKRDAGNTFKGYLRDLMIIGTAVTSEELGNITGKFD